MVHDRLVVGLQNAALSEKLQMDADLSLQTAISSACQREAVKQQQPVVRGESLPNVDAIDTRSLHMKGRSEPRKGPTRLPNPPPKVGTSQKVCTQCGRAPLHGQDRCPAREATCPKCKKKGHFQTQCWTKSVRTVQADHDDDVFIAAIHDHKSGENP